MKEKEKEKVAEDLLAALNNASGDRVGSVTVQIEQLVKCLGGGSSYVKGTKEHHRARVNPSKELCLVNRKQLIAELEKAFPKPEAADATVESGPDQWGDETTKPKSDKPLSAATK